MIDIGWQQFLVILVLLAADGVLMFACGWKFHQSWMKEEAFWKDQRKPGQVVVLPTPTPITDDVDETVWMPIAETPPTVLNESNIRRCPECNAALTLDLNHDIYRPKHSDGEYVVYIWSCPNGHDIPDNQEIDRV